MTKTIGQFGAAAFDLDGTLVDSAPDLASAANAMLQALGHAPLPEQRIAGMIGGGIDRLVEAALNESTGQPPSPELLRDAGDLFRQRYAGCLFDRSRVYPGVREALLRLRDARIPTCCITNKHSRFALPMLAAAKLDGLLAFTFCGDRAEERKPRPHMLLAACTRFAIAPSELLYVGDSGIDVRTARAAGCPVVAVNYGYNQERPIADERPDWIIGNLSEIVALLPVAQRATLH